MLENLLTDNYVKNIPWNKNPRKCFQGDNDKYEEAFKNVIELIPLSDKMISFSDNVWDFNPYFKDINSSSYKIIFYRASNDYIDYLKFFTIYKITRKSKISTANRRVTDFIIMISSIKNKKNNISFSLISTDDIIKFIESKEITAEAKHNYYVSALLIYDFILKNYDISLSIDIKELHEKSHQNKVLGKATGKKIPNIPEEYYALILDKAITVLNDVNKDYNMRMTAGLLIIETQTGLRIQDLLALKTTDLFKKKLPVSNITCHYLHFQTRKPSKAHSDMLEFNIYASEICADAFNTMLDLRKNCEFSKQPYLYVLNSNGTSKNVYPASTPTYTNQYRKFFYQELNDEVSRKWENIEPTVYSRGKVEVNIPKITQFRVHLATALYNNGVSLTYIQKYLGHMSEYMMGYYVRPKNPGIENADYAERIVRKIACDNMTPLGNMGEDLKKNLQDFIKKGKYNVKQDISQIVNDLGETLVVREKGPGTCCIKTSIIPCKYDMRTDKILCAFNLCPNIYHFFDQINVTYMQFQALQDTYQQNKTNEYQRAAEKELNKLKTLCHNRLIPELEELEKTIDNQGLETVIKKYPDLQYYAKNIEKIRKEIQLWENY